MKRLNEMKKEWTEIDPFFFIFVYLRGSFIFLGLTLII